MSKALFLSGLAGFLFFLALVAWERQLDLSFISLIVLLGGVLLLIACFPVLLKLLMLSSVLLIISVGSYVVYSQLHPPAPATANGLPADSTTTPATELSPHYGEPSKEPLLTVDIHPQAEQETETEPTRPKPAP